ncbi:MAG: SDR family NAD(P)-dependent oxidoreductase [Bacteroidota bacterium]
MNDNVLITGGAGFIGSHLCEKFVNEGFKVIVIDNLFRGKRENIEHLMLKGQVELIELDLSDFINIETLAEVLANHNPSKILHYAAINGTQYFYDIPEKVAEVNSLSTIYLLKAIEICKNKGANFKPLIVFASTSETYGEPFSLPTSEKDLTYIRIDNDRDSYAVAKIMSEFYVKLFSKKMGLNWIILRIFNVYGPKMIGTKYGQVIPEFVNRLKSGEYPLKIFGDGSHTRSFIHISDHVELTYRLIHSPNLKLDEVYNLGNTDEISIAHLANKLMNLMGLDPKLKFLKERSGDHKKRVPDITKLENVVGKYDFISLNEGLKSLI